VTNRVGLLALVIVTIILAVVVFSMSPIPQSAAYHDFADHRSFLGIPNGLDVISNLPFLFVGIWGLFVVAMRKSPDSFLRNSEKWPYAVFFLGVTLTFFGSSYYHLNPTNDTLVWDRLPMTFGFMGILSATIGERVSVRAGTLLLAPLVLAGVCSVFYWHSSEIHGHGDLRSYVLVQFGALIIILLSIVIFRPRYTMTWCMYLALALYAGAKLLEDCDRAIYNAGHLVSGHTLKHLTAAAACYVILYMVVHRTPVNKVTEKPASDRPLERSA
jgi:hypothetical protein